MRPAAMPLENDGDEFPPHCLGAPALAEIALRDDVDFIIDELDKAASGNETAFCVYTALSAILRLSATSRAPLLSQAQRDRLLLAVARARPAISGMFDVPKAAQFASTCTDAVVALIYHSTAGDAERATLPPGLLADFGDYARHLRNAAYNVQLIDNISRRAAERVGEVAGDILGSVYHDAST